MITLITAVPGSGKTLYTLKTVKEYSERKDEDYPAGRKVYYFNIPLTEKGEETLDWEKLAEPHKWFELPYGAIIVIDECQEVFPVRKAGSHVPKYVELFTKHRHYGFDIFLITQNGKLLDSYIREVVGRHTHLNRIFGAQAAQIYNWDKYCESVRSNSVLNQCADTHKFMYPKEVYGWYKSSQLHTHKLKLPRKFWIMLACLVVALIALISSIYILTHLGDDSVPRQTVQSSDMPSTQAAIPPSGSVEKRSVTPEEYINQRRVRVSGAPQSAPIYDELTKPRTFPRLSACVQMGSECKCYTQQGTEIKGIPPRSCGQYVAHGWFDDWQEDHLNRQLLADRDRVPPPLQISPPTAQQLPNRVVTVGERPPEQEGKS